MGSKVKYTDEVIKGLVEENSNCKFNGSYRKSTKTNRVLMLQLTCGCGEEFEVDWRKFNRKDGMKQRQCRKCGIEARAKASRMTNEMYIRLKREKGIVIEHLEPVEGSHKKARHKCPNCGDTDWFPIPKNILAGLSKQCLKCHMDVIGGNNKLTNEHYQILKSEKGIDIKNVEPYVDGRTNIIHICPECKNQWKVAPNRILSRNSERCEKCSYEKRGQDRVLSQDEVHEIVKKLGAEWVNGEYESNHSILTFKCECGSNFDKPYKDFRNGWVRCEKCAHSISVGEHAIMKWLETQGINYTPQRKFDDLRGVRKMPLSYDFSIDDEQGNPITLIEYDGFHHFQPLYHRFPTEQEAEKQFELVKKRDLRKTNYAKKKNIPLIRLSANQYKNLDKHLKHLI